MEINDAGNRGKHRGDLKKGGKPKKTLREKKAALLLKLLQSSLAA